MIALGIITILCTIFIIWYNVHLDVKYKSDGKLAVLLLFHGIWGGLIVTFFLAIGEKYIDKAPKAIDVYRGNTELKITYIDTVPQDTVVVWKNIGGVK